MAKAIWGMDFGAWSLKVARGSYDKKTDVVTIDLFDEIVYGQLPCGHEASPLQKHRAAIVAFRGNYEIGLGDDLCVAVSGSEVFHRFIPVPPVPGRLDDVMRYEASQQIPFELDDVVWSFQPVKEEEEREEGEEIEVGLFALKKEKVEELMALLGPWRQNLRIIQDAPLAVYNLLEYEGLVNEVLVVLDIGAATTDVIVFNPPRFWVRTLLVAGDDLTNALVEQFGIKVEEAERIKRRAGRSAHKDQILRILQPVFDDLVSEIQRSLGYYKSIWRDVRFGRVLALGSALKMTGLTDMLAAGLQYQVQSPRELTRIQLAESVDAERLRAALPQCCAALGLVVQGAGQGRMRINMVPEEVARTHIVSQKKPWVLAAAVGVLLVAGLLVLGEMLYARELATAEAQVPLGVLETARTLEDQYNEAAGALGKLQERLESLAKAGIDRGVYLQVLPAFAETIAGKDVYVTNLDFSWMEPGSIEAGVAPLIGAGFGVMRRPGAVFGPGAPGRVTGGPGMGRPTGGPPIGRRTGGPPGGRGAARSALRGRDRRSVAARTLVRARGVQAAQYSAQSQLVMRFACECKEASEAYIEEHVLKALRSAQLPDKLQPAFTEVKRLGELRDVYRDASTDELVGQPDEDTVHLVAFQGYAIVNTGQQTETGDEEGE